jgi:serine/threonine protein kinase/tetratricopeptide (TPR) repeat protein
LSGAETNLNPPAVLDVSSPASTLTPPGVGRVVAGRYEIRACLGAGGMGTVWRAYDRELEEEVALKTLLPERLQDPAMLERLRREVKTARRITHPNVCRVFDYGEDGDLRFLTMELIEGRTLRSLLAAGPLGPERALAALGQIVAGLAAAHEKGVVHRDLKPENVLVRSSGQAVVADFGLARAPLSDRQSATDFAGTPAYMSPEQLRGEALDARSDLFSLGILAFEMLAGRPPFAGGSAATKASAILRDPPAPLAIDGLPVETARAIEGVLARAMAKAPGGRYPSVRDFGAALAEAWEAGRSGDGGRTMSLPSSARSDPYRGRERGALGRRRVVASAAALAALFGAFLLARTNGPHDATPTIAVHPFDNLTGDPSWDGLARGAVEAIRTGLRAIPQVQLVDAPVPARPWAFFKPPRPTWVAAGNVQRVGDRLRLAVQLRAADGSLVGEPIEVDGAAGELGALPGALRQWSLDEVRLLARNYRWRQQAETATKSDRSKARLREYYDLVGPVPHSEHFETAERLLGEALAADPHYVPALVERASLRVYVGRSRAEREVFASAIADAEQALALAPGEPRALVLRCHGLQIRTHLNDRATDADVAAAMAACNDALRADPTSARAYLALARLSESTCQNELAMTSLHQAVELEADRSLLGLLLDQLTHAALQEGKLAVADRASQQLVDFYEQEKRAGARALSRRAGAPPVSGAHVMRAAVLMRLDQPGALERARGELLRELDTISGGIGDRWNEASALRGLLRIARLQGEPAPNTWRERLDALERDYRTSAHDKPHVIQGVAASYRRVDPDAALELVGLLGPPTSFDEVFKRSLIFHAAGRDDEARRVLELHAPVEQWERRCREWVRSQLAY